MIEWYTDKKGCYAVREYNPKKTLRSNKQIWRIAKWMYDEIRCYHCDSSGTRWGSPIIRDWWYDTALTLQRKLINNEFTGEDIHAD